MLPRLILVQIDSIIFHPLSNGSGRPKFKLDFLGPAGQLIGHYPVSGYQDALYGEEVRPNTGIFSRILVANDVGAAYLHVVAHDVNNPPAIYTVSNGHGGSVTVVSSPMSLNWGASIGSNQFIRHNGHAPTNDPLGISTTEEGTSFEERFTLNFFAWGDPPIKIGGGGGSR